MSMVAANLDRIRERIAAACERSGRPVSAVQLMAVSKRQSTASIRQAYAAGQRLFGENNVQEALAKSAELGELADLRWAVIGHLQTNKIKYLPRFAAELHALDSARVAEELDRRLQAAGREMDVFIQVNSSGEATKSGLPAEEVVGFWRSLLPLHSLRVRGLMTLAAFSTDRERVAGCFAQLQDLQRQVRQDDQIDTQAVELSMGMSGDFELAIEYGATIVRVGQAIFGERSA